MTHVWPLVEHAGVMFVAVVQRLSVCHCGWRSARAREAVQPQGTSAWRTEAVEQVYYGLEGVGLVEVEGEGECRFMEGDMLHLPVGSRFRLRNPSEHWLVSLIMAA